MATTNPGRRTRRRRLLVPLGAVAVLLPALTAGVATAAGTGVQVTSTGNGTRTLAVTDASGAPLTSASTLNATAGAVPFGLQVADNGYTNSGFQVSSTMSNLYNYTGSTWDCSKVIPSSAVKVFSGPNSAALSGLSAGLTPVFAVTGTLSSSLQSVLNLLLAPLGLGTVASSVNGTLNGLLPSSGGSLLSQSQLSGSSSATLLNGALTGLPINLASGATTATSFAQPAAPPSGSGCTDTTGSSATSVPLLNGTANPTGVQGVLSGLLGATPLSLTTLESNGYLDPNTVLNWLSSPGVLLVGGISPTLLSSTLGSTNLTSLLNAITGTLSTISGLSQSGTYSGAPQVSVVPGSAPNGTYRGEMTVTVMDLP